MSDTVRLLTKANQELTRQLEQYRERAERAELVTAELMTAETVEMMDASTGEYKYWIPVENPGLYQLRAI